MAFRRDRGGCAAFGIYYSIAFRSFLPLVISFGIGIGEVLMLSTGALVFFLLYRLGLIVFFPVFVIVSFLCRKLGFRKKIIPTERPVETLEKR